MQRNSLSQQKNVKFGTYFAQARKKFTQALLLHLYVFPSLINIPVIIFVKYVYGIYDTAGNDSIPRVYYNHGIYGNHRIYGIHGVYCFNIFEVFIILNKFLLFIELMEFSRAGQCKGLLYKHCVINSQNNSLSAAKSKPLEITQTIMN